MPTYVYECRSCGRTSEVFQKITDDPLTVCGCGGEVRRVPQRTYANGFAKDPRLDPATTVEGNLRHRQVIEEGIASGEFAGYYEHPDAAEEYRPDAGRVADLAAQGARQAERSADEALAASRSGSKSDRSKADESAAKAADKAKAAKTRAKTLAQSVPTSRSVGPVVQA